MQQVDRGIFYEDGYLGVTLGGLVFSHGTIMIDAPLRPEDARAWKSALLNQRGGSNRIMVNLDAHPDRTLGARNLECTIISHHKAAQVFRNRTTIFKGQNLLTGSAWESYNEAVGLRWAPPDITFTHQMSLFWGGPEIVLENYPGPSAGSIWIILPNEKVVFIGDTVVINQPPFLAHAELEEWLATLDQLGRQFSDYVIISGRGGLVSKKDIQAQSQVLKKAAKGIEKLVKKNASPEATEDLIPSMLAEFSPDRESLDLFTQRLRYGFFQYYARHYRPSSSLEPPASEESEQ